MALHSGGSIMTRHFAEITFTPSVLAAQKRFLGETMPVPFGEAQIRLGMREASFIAQRDSFYLATVGEGGWPHVQHRGGPPGFLRVLDERTLSFADYDGNRQLVSVGNLAAHAKAALIVMDYPNRRRLKILASIRIIPADEATPESLAAVHVRGAPPTERVMVLDVAAFDWNCSRNITPRYTESEWAASHPAGDA
jgi:uncharacterized protein